MAINTNRCNDASTFLQTSVGEVPDTYTANKDKQTFLARGFISKEPANYVANQSTHTFNGKTFGEYVEVAQKDYQMSKGYYPKQRDCRCWRGSGVTPYNSIKKNRMFVVLCAELAVIDDPHLHLPIGGYRGTPQKINSSIRNRIDSASSPSPVSCYTLEETLPQEALNEMVANLMKFLLLKCQAKELTSQVEMLKKVLRDNQEHFPVVFSQGSECLQLDCGIEVKEVDPSMVPTLGITCYAMLSSGQGLPKASLAVLVLSLIMWNGDHTPEEVWGALSRMGVCVESEHCVFGEPRTLLTHVWVQQGYMEYQQVLYSHPACYEFLWGTRAYAENSKWQVMAFLLRFKCKALRAFPMQSVEAAREEYEAA
ncbi:melanoma-associated antigen 10-like [Bubalus bubalis]|uniref:melanoma-associated antigen 10-like n=1 Tax=Bubalus bubalis TaxID=89462 RepID=UPI00042CEFDE|nr:melanoma-associated antigen 10-like [Bubalus bubalis]